jgi:hypothetical protein
VKDKGKKYVKSDKPNRVCFSSVGNHSAQMLEIIAINSQEG